VRATGSSFYLPDSMGSKRSRIAVESMDDKPRGLSAAAKTLGGNGTIELSTNNVEAAQFIEARMRALGVHGYVRIVEPQETEWNPWLQSLRATTRSTPRRWSRTHESPGP
jgi:hypothetical protein